MSFNPHISVLIPLYNNIEFLEESLESVITQSYDNWEVIIGIYGHKIGSDIEKKAMDILHKYDRFQYKIRVIVYNTQYRSETMNHMVIDSTYDYIAILDVGDIWMSKKLENQVPLLQHYDVVGTSCEYFGAVKGYPNIPIGDLKNTNFLICNPVISCSAIIRKCYINWDDSEYQHKIKGFEDYDMWLRLKYKERSFYNINKILCKHFVHKESVLNNIDTIYLNELKSKWKKEFGL